MNMAHLVELQKEWSDKPMENLVFQTKVVMVQHSQKKLRVSIQQLCDLECEINGLSERIKVILSGPEPMCVCWGGWGRAGNAVVTQTLALDS